MADPRERHAAFIKAAEERVDAAFLGKLGKKQPAPRYRVSASIGGMLFFRVRIDGLPPGQYSTTQPDNAELFDFLSIAELAAAEMNGNPLWSGVTWAAEPAPLKGARS